MAGGFLGYAWALDTGCEGMSCMLGAFWGLAIGALVADIGFLGLLFVPPRTGRRKAAHHSETNGPASDSVAVPAVAQRLILVPAGMLIIFGFLSFLMLNDPGFPITVTSIASGLLFMHYLALRRWPAAIRWSVFAELLASLLVFLFWPFLLGAPYSWGIGCLKYLWVENVLIEPLILLTMVIGALSSVHAFLATVTPTPRLQRVARRQFIVFTVLSGLSLTGMVIVGWDVCF